MSASWELTQLMTAFTLITSKGQDKSKVGNCPHECCSKLKGESIHGGDFHLKKGISDTHSPPINI
jgi:hypothetical protein